MEKRLGLRQDEQDPQEQQQQSTWPRELSDFQDQVFVPKRLSVTESGHG
jgi:hypothetical protein